jgi:HSP20 family protein
MTARPRRHIPAAQAAADLERRRYGMKLMKRIFNRHDQDRSNQRTALAKRDDRRGGFLAPRRDGSWPIDTDAIWRDVGRDPRSVFDQLGESLATRWPAVDVAEDDASVTVRYDVPGMDPSNLEVEVAGNLLIVRGSREDEWTDKNRGVRRRERVSGTFARTLTLPDYVDPAHVEAKYDRGTLTVTAPKIPGKGPKRVAVHAA